MLNYHVPPELVLPFVPVGTELDLWDGAASISLIGFLFHDTRLLGVPVPFHRHFEEVNLRLHVRRQVDGETRRAATFIRELVPRTAVARVAHLAYNEPYRALPMRHRIDGPSPGSLRMAVEYEWKQSSTWNGIHLDVEGDPNLPQPGSESEFVTQRFWGYSRQRDGSTFEYAVHHPPWNVWHAATARLEGGLTDIFPPQFAPILQRPPDSTLLADGSAVTVYSPLRIGRPARTSTSRVV